MYAEPLAEVKPEAERIQQGAAAQHSLMSSDASREIGEWIGGIGDDEQQRVGRSGDEPRDEVPVDAGIRAKQPQAACGVVAVRGAAGLLVRAYRDHDERRAAQISVVSRP